jgi:hypothetical protein
MTLQLAVRREAAWNYWALAPVTVDGRLRRSGRQVLPAHLR